MVEPERISTGIPALDELIAGGFPHPSTIGLVGVRSTSSELLYRFACNPFQNNPSLFITTKHDIMTIRSQTGQKDLDLNNVVFLDAVHWRTKRFDPQSRSEADFVLSNLSDLNALLAKLMEAQKEHSFNRIVFDSISSLLLYSTPGKEQVFKFFELFTAFARSNSISIVFSLDPDIHPSEVTATMKFLSDGVVKCENDTIYLQEMILTEVNPEKAVKIQDLLHEDEQQFPDLQ